MISYKASVAQIWALFRLNDRQWCLSKPRSPKYGRPNNKYWLPNKNSVGHDVRINIWRIEKDSVAWLWTWCILFLRMHDGLEHIACLLTTDTGDAGSSPHVAR